jgi:hypothetical protein
MAFQPTIQNIDLILLFQTSFAHATHDPIPRASIVGRANHSAGRRTDMAKDSNPSLARFAYATHDSLSPRQPSIMGKDALRRAP